jgi:hypothetical protein
MKMGIPSGHQQGHQVYQDIFPGREELEAQHLLHRDEKSAVRTPLILLV